MDWKKEFEKEYNKQIDIVNNQKQLYGNNYGKVIDRANEKKASSSKSVSSEAPKPTYTSALDKARKSNSVKAPTVDTDVFVAPARARQLQNEQNYLIKPKAQTITPIEDMSTAQLLGSDVLSHVEDAGGIGVNLAKSIVRKGEPDNAVGKFFYNNAQNVLKDYGDSYDNFKDYQVQTNQELNQRIDENIENPILNKAAKLGVQGLESAATQGSYAILTAPIATIFGTAATSMLSKEVGQAGTKIGTLMQNVPANSNLAKEVFNKATKAVNIQNVAFAKAANLFGSRAAWMGLGAGLDRYNELRDSGVSEAEAQARGITDGLVSYFIEASSGIAKNDSSLLAQLNSRIGDITAKAAAKSGVINAIQKFASTRFGQFVGDVVGEGNEEVAEKLTNWVTDGVYDYIYKNNLQEDVTIQGLVDAWLGGAAGALIMSGGKYAADSVGLAVDAKLSKQDEAIIKEMADVAKIATAEDIREKAQAVVDAEQEMQTTQPNVQAQPVVPVQQTPVAQRITSNVEMIDAVLSNPNLTVEGQIATINALKKQLNPAGRKEAMRVIAQLKNPTPIAPQNMPVEAVTEQVDNLPNVPTNEQNGELASQTETVEPIPVTVPQNMPIAEPNTQVNEPQKVITPANAPDNVRERLVNEALAKQKAEDAERKKKAKQEAKQKAVEEVPKTKTKQPKTAVERNADVLNAQKQTAEKKEKVEKSVKPKAVPKTIKSVKRNLHKSNETEIMRILEDDKTTTAQKMGLLNEVASSGTKYAREDTDYAKQYLKTVEPDVEDIKPVDTSVDNKAIIPKEELDTNYKNAIANAATYGILPQDIKTKISDVLHQEGKTLEEMNAGLDSIARHTQDQYERDAIYEVQKAYAEQLNQNTENLSEEEIDGITNNMLDKFEDSINDMPLETGDNLLNIFYDGQTLNDIYNDIVEFESKTRESDAKSADTIKKIAEDFRAKYIDKPQGIRISMQKFGGKKVTSPTEEAGIPQTEEREDGKYALNTAHDNLIKAGLETTDDVKKIISDGIYEAYHKVHSYKEAVEEAQNYLENNSLEQFLKTWEGKRQRHIEMTDTDVLIAKGVLRYLNTQNTAEAKELHDQLAAEYAARRAVTARTLGIGRLDLDSDLGINMNNKPAIERLVEEINAEFEGKINTESGKIELNQELLDAAEKANGTNEEGKAWDRVYENIANQIKPDFWDGIDSWRYFCMLCNPKTHVRNILGNTFMNGMRKVTDVVEKPLTALWNNSKRVKDGKVGKVSGKYLGKVSAEYKEFAADDFDQYKESFAEKKYEGSTRTGFVAKYRTANIGIDKTITNKVAKLLKIKGNADTKFGKMLNGITERGGINTLIDANSRLLTEEDYKAEKSIYTDALARYMLANNIDWQTADTNPKMEDARAYALSEALYNTFNQSNAAINAFNKFIHTGNNKLSVRTKEVISGAVIPFTKVPVNIAGTAIDYSPVGLIMNTKNVLDAMYNAKSEVDAEAAIRGVAKGLTGSAIAGIGMLLRSLGKLYTTLPDEKKAKDLAKANGEQAYSLVLNDRGDSITLDWLAPFSIMLFSGATMYDYITDEENLGKGALDLTLNAITSFYEPMFEMSFLSNLKELMTSYGEDDEKISAKAEDILTDYAGQFIPQLVYAFGRTLDEYQRNPYYVDKTNDIGDTIEKPLNKLKSKIPGLEETLTQKVDVWGRPMKTTDVLNNNVAGRALQNFILPATYKTGKADKYDAALMQLYKKTGSSKVLPTMTAHSVTVQAAKGSSTKKDLSGEEWSKVQQTRGRNQRKLVEQLIDSSRYGKLTDEQKIKVLGNMNDYSLDKGTQAVAPSHTPTEKWISNMEKGAKKGYNKTDFILDRNIKQNLSKGTTFVDALKKQGRNNSDIYNALQYVADTDMESYLDVAGSKANAITYYSAVKDDAKKVDDIKSLAKATGQSEYAVHGKYQSLVASKKFENGKFKGFGSSQEEKANYMLNKSSDGITWTGEKIAKAARAVTGLQDYLGGKKANRNNTAYIEALTAVGFTKEQAKTFLKYYGW